QLAQAGVDQFALDEGFQELGQEFLAGGLGMGMLLEIDPVCSERGNGNTLRRGFGGVVPSIQVSSIRDWTRTPGTIVPAGGSFVYYLSPAKSFLDLRSCFAFPFFEPGLQRHKPARSANENHQVVGPIQPGVCTLRTKHPDSGSASKQNQLFALRHRHLALSSLVRACNAINQSRACYARESSRNCLQYLSFSRRRTSLTSWLARMASL